jgi:hypothetical protein
MNTRASNANKHPGQVVLNSGTCHPREVVRAQHTSRAAEKEQLATVQEEGIQDVARIENNARKAKNLRFDQQKNNLTIPRATRVRKPRAATPLDQGKPTPSINNKRLPKPSRW